VVRRQFRKAGHVVVARSGGLISRQAHGREVRCALLKGRFTDHSRLLTVRRSGVMDRLSLIGRGARWSQLPTLPAHVRGLAAVTHAEVREQRRALIAEWRMHRVLARRAGHGRDMNRIAPALPRLTGPMSRGELYHWHQACGTLEVFFAMFAT